VLPLVDRQTAQADTVEVEPTQSGVYFVIDPNHSFGTKHWEVFSDHEITAASVMASSQDDMLGLGCDAHHKSIALTADFTRVLHAFQTHRNFTAIVMDTSGEVRRDDFALAAAKPSIDFVFAACGRKRDWK
jgi:hypothetical protein